MYITIEAITALHEQGKRDYNQDSIYPEYKQLDLVDRLFLVCDGVGGGSCGDLASRVVSREVAKWLHEQVDGTPSSDDLHHALRRAEEQLDRETEAHPACQGMATTLTLLHLGEAGATMAWAGDSRIYHYREGQIVHQTTDHSLVNALLAQGEITEEEALDHPRKNVILRAVKGSDEPAKIDLLHTADLQPGDVFLLCTDGILEGATGDEIGFWLKEDHRLDKVGDRIRQACAERARDNYSMIMLRLGEVNQGGGTTAESPITTPAPTNERGGGLSRIVLITLTMLVFAAAGFWLFRTFAPPAERIHLTPNLGDGLMVEHRQVWYALDAWIRPGMNRSQLTTMDRISEGSRPYGKLNLHILTAAPRLEEGQDYLRRLMVNHPQMRFHLAPDSLWESIFVNRTKRMIGHKPGDGPQQGIGFHFDERGKTVAVQVDTNQIRTVLIMGMLPDGMDFRSTWKDYHFAIFLGEGISEDNVKKAETAGIEKLILMPGQRESADANSLMKTIDGLEVADSTAYFSI